jgi:hypothetical protein
VVVVVVVVGSAVVVDTPKAPTKRGIVVVLAVALEGAIVVVTGLGDVPIGNCPAPGDADPEATVVVVAPTVVVVAGGSVVVVVVLVVVVVVVLVVVVVAGGAVAGEEVGVTLPVHGNGVPQLNVGVFTPETVRAKLLESFKSDPEVTACRRSLVFATADSGPLGVKADVYRAVPFTK